MIWDTIRTSVNVLLYTEVLHSRLKKCSYVPNDSQYFHVTMIQLLSDCMFNNLTDDKLSNNKQNTCTGIIIKWNYFYQCSNQNKICLLLYPFSNLVEHACNFKQRHFNNKLVILMTFFFIFQLVLKEKLLVQSMFVANCCWNPRINYLYWVYTQIWMYPYMNTRFINLFFRIHQFNMKTSQIVKDNIIELMNIM